LSCIKKSHCKESQLNLKKVACFIIVRFIAENRDAADQADAIADDNEEDFNPKSLISKQNTVDDSNNQRKLKCFVYTL